MGDHGPRVSLLVGVSDRELHPCEPTALFGLVGCWFKSGRIPGHCHFGGLSLSSAVGSLDGETTREPAEALGQNLPTTRRGEEGGQRITAFGGTEQESQYLLFEDTGF